MSEDSVTSMVQLSLMDPTGSAELTGLPRRRINLDAYRSPVHAPQPTVPIPPEARHMMDYRAPHPAQPAAFDQARFRPPEHPHQIKDIHSCVDVAYHIRSCPICAKFYTCEKNYLIVSIIVLLIIVGLLIKHIMDQPRRIA